MASRSKARSILQKQKKNPDSQGVEPTRHRRHHGKKCLRVDSQTAFLALVCHALHPHYAAQHTVTAHKRYHNRTDTGCAQPGTCAQRTTHTQARRDKDSLLPTHKTQEIPVGPLILVAMDFKLAMSHTQTHGDTNIVDNRTTRANGQEQRAHMGIPVVSLIFIAMNLKFALSPAVAWGTSRQKIAMLRAMPTLAMVAATRACFSSGLQCDVLSLPRDRPGHDDHHRRDNRADAAPVLGVLVRPIPGGDDDTDGVVPTPEDTAPASGAVEAVLKMGCPCLLRFHLLANDGSAGMRDRE